MSSKLAEVLLFDVGGVLIELGPPPLEPGWVSGRIVEEVWHDWIAMPAGRDFERGLTTPDVFADEMIRGLSLEVSPEDFLTSFTAWPRAPYAGTHDWLRSLQLCTRIALLSNTNVLHAVRMRDEMHLLDAVDTAIFSNEIGLVKPDTDCFDAAVKMLDVPAERIAFFDDNAGNVKAARAYGLQAYHTVGPDAVREAVSTLQQ